MTTRTKLPIAVLAVLLSVSAMATQAAEVQQDAKAIEVLQAMAAYKTTLDRFVIKGVTFADARLDAGLIVANAEEINLSVSRPGSMLISSFDGVATKGLYFQGGLLTFFNSANRLYAQASIPEDFEAAMQFALDELDIEAPLMDMIYKDAVAHLVASGDEVLYLTDKARVGGSDCHHLAIRGPEADVQLWVEEGDRPLPRRIMITSKWKGGSPRFVANLNWEIDPQFEPGLFEFKAPEDATKIDFIKGSSR